MDEPRLELLRVLRARRPAGAALRADRQRHLQLPARHVAVLRRLVDDLLHRERQEVLVHDLDDRAHALHRRADAGADDRHLGDRRVADALGAELVEHPLRDAHRAAHLGDVLAHDEDVLVARASPRDERVAHGLAVGQLRHRRSSARLRASGRCRSSRTRPRPRRSRAPRASIASHSSSESSSFVAQLARSGPASRAARCSSSFGAVDLRVADVVAGEPVRSRRRGRRGPCRRARARAPLRALLVDLLDVLPVDLDRRACRTPPRAWTMSSIGECCARGRRLGPVVVLADEDGGTRPELREVERLVERADVRRAVAEERDRDARLAAQLERERRRRRSPAGRRRRPRSRPGCRARRRRGASSRRSRASSPRPSRRARPSARSGACPCASVCPCARCVEAMTSPSSSARQTPTATASWPIATCRKPGQLAGAEPLLDLLLEAPDQQHLAEEVAQLLLARASASSLDLRHGARVYGMLRAMRLVEQWNELERRLPGRLGRRAARRSTVDDAATPTRAAALLGARRTRAGAATRSASSRVRAAGRRRAATASAALLRRLDDEGIGGRLELAGRRADAPSRRRRRRAEPRSPRRGTPRSQTLPPDWSDLYAEVELDARPTTSSARRSCSRPLNPAPPTASALALPLPRRAHASATAPRPRWCAAASSAATSEGIPGAVESCARSPTRSRSRRRARSGTSAGEAV